MPMSSIHQSITDAIRAHWQAHNNAYPQKIILSPAQNLELREMQRIAGIGQGKPADAPLRTDKFLGVIIEVEASSTGVLIAHDGTQHPLPQ